VLHGLRSYLRSNSLGFSQRARGYQGTTSRVNGEHGLAGILWAETQMGTQNGDHLIVAGGETLSFVEMRLL